jgi:hypothetical protein
MLPARGQSRGWIEGQILVENLAGEVQPLLDAAAEEPLGFDLLAEAYGLSHMAPRSSLILAVAALEIGTKCFIADLVPDAEWLALSAPTPPIEQILTEYLPKLPVAHRLPSGRVTGPPLSTMKVVKKAVFARNGVTHRGAASRTKLLDETLEAVSDTLRLLDYYRGESWAVDHMTFEFSKALGLR